jgi:hypothetical protein
MATLILEHREVIVHIGGIDGRDYPDFTDAYFEDAVWADTDEPLTEAEYDLLYADYHDAINELAHEQIH